MCKRFAFAITLFVPILVQAQTITISAAASLKEALTDISHQFQTDTGSTVELNFGASGTLAAQIQQGAPVDLFISADTEHVDALIKANLADAATRQVVAGNRLVLIVPKDSAKIPKDFKDLADPAYAKIAIGQPKVVPAGAYAMQTLKSLGLDESLAAKLVMGENVRQVLAYVIRGEADAGIVYATDAAAAGDAVHVALVADESTHEPIVYPAVILKSGKQDLARKFLDYLKTDKAKAILATHGFSLPPAPATQP